MRAPPRPSWYAASDREWASEYLAVTAFREGFSLGSVPSVGRYYLLNVETGAERSTLAAPGVQWGTREKRALPMMRVAARASGPWLPLLGRWAWRAA